MLEHNISRNKRILFPKKYHLSFWFNPRFNSENAIQAEPNHYLLNLNLITLRQRANKFPTFHSGLPQINQTKFRHPSQPE